MLAAVSLARGFVTQPSYTDAYYHFNAAVRLARGDGFVENYLWNYLDAPERLPAPSHRYWMPLSAMLAALGMTLVNAPGSYAASQAPFILCSAGGGLVAYHLALLLSGRLRPAWIAGLLTVFGGFFGPRWGAIDTFAPYALIGSLTLLCIGRARSIGDGQSRHWILAGGLSALAHLTRPDGALLLLAACFVAVIQPTGARGPLPRKSRLRFKPLLLVVISYLLTMLPWFARNIAALSLILPTGGLQGIFFSEYDELFRYSTIAPPPVSADYILRLLAVRWTAIVESLATLVAVEGVIFLAPFMLIGWRRFRTHPMLRGFTFLAVAIHFVMIWVFPIQGFRGGLFHAVAALFPFWMALGMLGLEITVDWAASRRHSWNASQAKNVFSLAALAYGIAVTLGIALTARVEERYDLPRLYRGLREVLPDDARVMINDPAQLYYYLGMGGVTIPSESGAIVPIIAKQYDIEFLVLEHVAGDGRIGGAPAAFQFEVDNPPQFLRALAFDAREDARLYQIVLD